MMIFSLGTVPLMFGLGAISSILGKKFSKRIMSAGAVLVTIMGLFMLSYGWNLSGFSIPDFSNIQASAVSYQDGAKNPVSNPSQSAPDITIENGVQIVNSTLSSGRYPAITVQAGIPVKWIIEAPQGSINGCNNRMVIREYKIEHKFSLGTNVIEFLPEKPGKFRYSCWMGMIRSTITVLEQGAEAASANNPNNEADSSMQDILEEPVPAGFRIPVKEIAVGAIEKKDGETIQKIKIELTEKGFKPAAVVMQKGIETVWTINNISYKKNDAGLRFPLYGQEIPAEENENNILLYPQDDFEFSTSDSDYYGYVKVVNDLKNFNMEKIKSEISSYQTTIYPDNYFSGGGMSCCRSPQ
jgi:plastocyanin domain-containing protein